MNTSQHTDFPITAYPKILKPEEIKSLIPHREPMLLIHQAEILSPTEIISSFTIKDDSFFLKGHYPNNPIVPGNIQSEMLAQLGAILIYYNITQPNLPFCELRQNRTPLLAGLDNVRFRQQVKPNDTIKLSLQLTKDVGLIVNAQGRIIITDEKSPADGLTTLTAELILAFI